MLNRLTMAVPTGNIGCEVTALCVALVYKVFQNLIESMTNMNRAICIRRTIMQYKRSVVLILFKHLMININIVPELKALWFVFGQICTHRKVGARQVHSLLVAIGHGATFLPLLVLSLYLLLFSFQKLTLRSLYVSASFGS